MRDRPRQRRVAHQRDLEREADRLATVAAALGVQQVVLFGSAVDGEPGLSSDLDLLIVWDTPLDFLERTVALYRHLAPRVPVDLLVYTPEEMGVMEKRPFVRAALERGRVLYEA
ncbi:MAG: nucleotidyltransferase domain-containing protein [Anaerolineae bacterium]|nr:nucleotidyltransferase domain-containing protein [Anaerolineae bacterium]